jgi:hypothetical protein
MKKKAGWRLPAACLPVGRVGRKKHNTGTFKKKTIQMPKNAITALILGTYVHHNEGLSYNK